MEKALQRGGPRVGGSGLYLFVALLVMVVVFVGSLAIGPYYVGGDQVHYRAVYDALSEEGFWEGFGFYSRSLSSKEYVHFFTSWVASRHISKDLFVALSNFALVGAWFLAAKRVGAAVAVAASIALTNYYFFVLFFPAERLKFGMLFLFLSVAHIGDVRWRGAFALLAVASHVQLAVLYGAGVLGYSVRQVLKGLLQGVLDKVFLLGLAVGALVLVLFFDQLTSKVAAYFALRSPLEPMKMIAFMALTLFYCRRWEVVAIFVSLSLATLLVGGERLNMFGYFVFLYYAVGVRRGWNFGVLVTSAYFAWKGFGFVADVLNYGDGFYIAS